MVSRKYNGNQLTDMLPGEASEATSGERYFVNWIATRYLELILLRSDQCSLLAHSREH